MGPGCLPFGIGFPHQVNVMLIIISAIRGDHALDGAKIGVFGDQPEMHERGADIDLEQLCVAQVCKGRAYQLIGAAEFDASRIRSAVSASLVVIIPPPRVLIIFEVSKLK